MPQRWIEIAILVSGIAGVGFMLLGAFVTSSFSLPGIVLCGLAGGLTVVIGSRRQQAQRAADQTAE